MPTPIWEERMNLLEGPVSLVAFLVIVVGFSCLIAARSPRSSVLSVTLLSTALSSIVYVVFYSFLFGPPAFILIGLVTTFLYYLPIALIVSIVCRILQRRRTNFFRNGSVIDQKDRGE